MAKAKTAPTRDNGPKIRVWRSKIDDHWYFTRHKRGGRADYTSRAFAQRHQAVKAAQDAAAEARVEIEE